MALGQVRHLIGAKRALPCHILARVLSRRHRKERPVRVQLAELRHQPSSVSNPAERKLWLMVEDQRNHMRGWLAIRLRKRKRANPNRLLRDAALPQHIDFQPTLVFNLRVLRVSVRVDQVAQLKNTNESRFVGKRILLVPATSRLIIRRDCSVAQKIEATSTSQLFQAILALNLDLRAVVNVATESLVIHIAHITVKQHLPPGDYAHPDAVQRTPMARMVSNLHSRAWIQQALPEGRHHALVDLRRRKPPVDCKLCLLSITLPSRVLAQDRAACTRVQGPQIRRKHAP